MNKQLSIIILTKDEEENLPFALQSVKKLDANIFVVDSGSSDKTTEIARAHGAVVVYNKWINYAKQFNWALDNIRIETPWVMRLDADEYLLPELVFCLKREMIAAGADVSGLLVRRRVYFWGKWIRHGGYYPVWLLRVWRTGCGRCEDTWMDEHILLSGGRIKKVSGDLVDENRKGLSFWVNKHNSYADREVRSMLESEPLIRPEEAGEQAARKRSIKKGIYGKMPPILRAVVYWFYRYFVRLGFLDGRAGFVFHLFQGLWYRTLVDAKMIEAGLRRAAK